ncbi:CAAX prenyl protease-related protein [Geobacter grbiciae]|uniref:CAAX prenyl protease-related protein n=1 Tax=Geobacter grbiciae TaxID=155042 RepID=UPI002484BA4F|nr:CAAX prenyl protease-related protein [Geobacter grbiciae]
MHTRTLAHILPFAVFMAFIAIEGLLPWLDNNGVIALRPESPLFLYPFKTMVVGLLLLYFRKHYHEISIKQIIRPSIAISAILAGIIVFVLWIQMDWLLPFQKPAQGYNPDLISDHIHRTVLIAFRVAGASIVVPIMEEIFWRSYIARLVINQDFESVPVGTFTWASFIATVLLFGLEHQFIIAGCMAGVIYHALLCRTKSLSACIVTHSLTNLLLGIYVVKTKAWPFW